MSNLTIPCIPVALVTNTKGIYDRKIDSVTGLAKMAEPYHYVRFRWWSRVDLKRVSEDLSELFHIERVSLPRDESELSLFKDEREELKVSADTLTAWISVFRAVIFQKEAAPFTARDVELRKKVLELYPRSRPSPFPWSFSHEPKFEVAK